MEHLVRALRRPALVAAVVTVPHTHTVLDLEVSNFSGGLTNPAQWAGFSQLPSTGFAY